MAASALSIVHCRTPDRSRRHYPTRGHPMRFIILWLLGVPVGLLILLKIFGVF